MQTNDGFMNALSGAGTVGIGSGLSPVATAGLEYAFLNQNPAAIAELYLTSGLAKQIIDLPVMTAISRWVEADALVLDELKRVNARAILKDAGKTARLFGGALIVAYLEDGATSLEEPLRLTLKQVKGFEVIDRQYVSTANSDTCTDLASPNYGCPDYYTINSPKGHDTISRRVHYTRCYVMRGGYLPTVERVRNQGWGNSALAPSIKALGDFMYVQSSLPSIIKDFITVIIGIDGLTAKIMTGEDDKIKKKISLINWGRSIINSIVLDKNDSYEKKASSVSGLDALIDRCMINVAASCGIPATLLFGMAPAGMNATGEGDMNNWHQAVAAYQEDELGPLVDWVFGLLALQTQWVDKRPDSFNWQWPDLSPISEMDRADIKLKNAQADAFYMTAGAVDPGYLYSLRFKGQTYNFDPAFTKEGEDEFMTKYLGGAPSGQTQAEAENPAP